MFEEKVRELAYQKWEKAGYPTGDGVCFWLEAERELSDCPTNHVPKAVKKAAKASPSVGKKSMPKTR